MSDESALLPLQRTHESILRIKKYLTPFLMLLKRYHHDDNHNIIGNSSSNNNNHNNHNHKSHGEKNSNGKNVNVNISIPRSKKDMSKATISIHQVREAEAAVALAMGTLRYMAHRLKGQERGKKKNDPISTELHRMKQTLSQVEALITKEDQHPINHPCRDDYDGDHDDDDVNDNDSCLLQSHRNVQDQSITKRKRNDPEDTNEDTHGSNHALKKVKRKA